ncbi:MAG: acyl-protein synthetase [Myxococcales bacterium]|nr:acyl-protein synthetase [Myxococcales bacterium]
MTAAADALHARVRAVIDAFGFEGPLDFDALARDLACHQVAHDAGYRRLCAARGVDPTLAPPSALPAVPTDAFKLTRVASFPPALDAVVFRTSGTTIGARGAHALRRIDTYRAAALAAADRLLFPRGAGPVLAIADPPSVAPDSSLSCMLGWFVEAYGGRFVSPTDPAGIAAALSACEGPTLVAATAFAWVHLVDAGVRATLPAGSRAMQTGGFKGRSREVSPAQLRADLAQTLGIPPADVTGEYGMTELSSQLYAHGEPDRWRYVAPPWVRVRACDPDSLAQLPANSVGVLRIEDLANVESAWAVQTADLGVVHEDGRVELHGRAAGAPPRGCSLAIEELLGS